MFWGIMGRTDIELAVGDKGNRAWEQLLGGGISASYCDGGLGEADLGLGWGQEFLHLQPSTAT